MDEERYEITWRNKWLTANIQSIDEMISAVREAANGLKQMRDAGVFLDPNGGTSDDYARLVTTERGVAARFAFPPADICDDADE